MIQGPLSSQAAGRGELPAPDIFCAGRNDSFLESGHTVSVVHPGGTGWNHDNEESQSAVSCPSAASVLEIIKTH
jgi:hypothetical protein